MVLARVLARFMVIQISNQQVFRDFVWDVKISNIEHREHLKYLTLNCQRQIWQGVHPEMPGFCGDIKTVEISWYPLVMTNVAT